MLQISTGQIKRLDSDQTRELIHQLAKAELRERGLPVSGVLAGGEGRAPDGGIDVRVEPRSHRELDFIPRPETVFQAKAEKMTASRIRQEMLSSQGTPRAMFQDLAQQGGAYVIVSSRNSDAEPVRQQRVADMHAVLDGTPFSSRVHLDFYDADRLASWTNEYPSVGQWVRDCLGETLLGWRGFGHWSAADAKETGYILDDHARIACPSDASNEPVSVEAGIEHMRTRLRKTGGVARLTGLSGVGKTRLV